MQDLAREVGERRHRSAPLALEDPLLAGEHHVHRQVGERGGDDGEGHDGRHVERRLLDDMAPGQGEPGVAEQQVEDDQDHDGEGEGEVGGGRVAPERLVLVAHLAQSQSGSAHSVPATPPVNSRYTSWSDGFETVRSASSTASVSAHPVWSCNTRTGSLVTMT